MGTWVKELRWDGVSHKDELVKALLTYITGAEKHQAIITSYGDLAVLLKKNHVNNGSGNDERDIWGMPQGIEITIHNGKVRYRTQLTWNQAAKLIHMELMAKAGK